jgi:hypothetical protein
LRYFLNLRPLHPFPTHYAPRTTHPIPLNLVLQRHYGFLMQSEEVQGMPLLVAGSEFILK